MIENRPSFTNALLNSDLEFYVASEILEARNSKLQQHREHETSAKLLFWQVALTALDEVLAREETIFSQETLLTENMSLTQLATLRTSLQTLTTELQSETGVTVKLRVQGGVERTQRRHWSSIPKSKTVLTEYAEHMTQRGWTKSVDEILVTLPPEKERKRQEVLNSNDCSVSKSWASLPSSSSFSVLFDKKKKE